MSPNSGARTANRFFTPMITTYQNTTPRWGFSRKLCSTVGSGSCRAGRRVGWPLAGTHIKAHAETRWCRCHFVDFGNTAIADIGTCSLSAQSTSSNYAPNKFVSVRCVRASRIRGITSNRLPPQRPEYTVAETYPVHSDPVICWVRPTRKDPQRE